MDALLHVFSESHEKSLVLITASPYSNVGSVKSAEDFDVSHFSNSFIAKTTGSVSSRNL